MSSILTNTSAMVALQTLKNINVGLGKIQTEISTGKTVSNAKDNAAVWAITKVMESDVKGFKGISESLSLGSATLEVARKSAETVTDLLTEIRSKIVSAQAENVDRNKMQTDIAGLRSQISTIAGSAQLYGLNMLVGTEDVQVLGSLDRGSDGSVTASTVTLKRFDITTSSGTYGSGAALNSNAVVSETAANALNKTGNTAQMTMATAADYSTGAFSLTVGGVQVDFAAGDLGNGDQAAAATIVAARVNALGIKGVQVAATGAVLTLTSERAFEGLALSISGATGAAYNATLAQSTRFSAMNGTAGATSSGTISERALSVTFSANAAVKEGDSYQVSMGGQQISYTARAQDSWEDIARGLKAGVDGKAIAGVTTSVVKNASGAWQLKVDNNSATAMTLAAIGNEGGTAAGGLYGLDGIDVSTREGAKAALENIDRMIGQAIDASSSFGSSQSRLETQKSFVSLLSDALKSGIGSMVDTDMEEASARLQALQVQQQLSVQALSIANQAPQTILTLFR